MKITFRMLLTSLALAVFLNTLLSNSAIGNAQEDRQNTTFSQKDNLTYYRGLNVLNISIKNGTDVCKVFPKIFFPDLQEPISPLDLEILCSPPRPKSGRGGEGGCYYFRIIHQPDSNNKCEDVIVVPPENQLNDHLTVLKAEF